MTSAALKDSIRKAARALGFERVGFCSTEPTPHAAFVDTWLTQGWHGTMDWVARNPEWRKDIRSRFGWAKSFVALNIEYPSALPEKLPAKSALPNIARYARGRDYHDVHEPALQKLEAEIARLGGPGTEAKWYQDTGPFLERAIAQQSGLGWVGKNTMLIDPQRGSWSFLALVVTSLELAPDTPGTDHCGTCTRCLDACPTDAFPAPYQLNATRCISYLTIEHSGPIDEALRPGMGEWVFGCDICNEVCPWNSKASGQRAEPSGELAGVTLSRILTSRPEHLHKRIVGTPLARAGEGNLKRNAAITAGNLKQDSLLPSLEQALQTDDETVQEAVVWALMQYAPETARAAVARAQRYVVSPELRNSMIEWLQGTVPGDTEG